MPWQTRHPQCQAQVLERCHKSVLSSEKRVCPNLLSDLGPWRRAGEWSFWGTFEEAETRELGRVVA